MSIYAVYSASGWSVGEGPLDYVRANSEEEALERFSNRVVDVEKLSEAEVFDHLDDISKQISIHEQRYDKLVSLRMQEINNV